MKRMILVAVLLCLFAGAAEAETIKLGGSGGMISLMTELAKAYMAKHPGDTIEVMQQSIEAKGGIMGAYEGRLDVGMSARQLKREETALGLVPVEIARVAGVFAVHAASVKARGLKVSDVCGIYAGKIKNWKEVGGSDSAIRVFTKSDADSTKMVMRTGLACYGALTEAPSVMVMPKAEDMFQALLHNPGAIGITDMVSVENSKGKLRALSLDGLDPSEANVKSGSWPVIKRYVLVTKGEPKALAKRFMDFIRGPEGTRIISNDRAVPVR
jgi:phosphate transport system substrate-binding protein